MSDTVSYVGVFCEDDNSVSIIESASIENIPDNLSRGQDVTCLFEIITEGKKNIRKFGCRVVAYGLWYNDEKPW